MTLTRSLTAAAVYETLVPLSRVDRYFEFACQSKACAPPPVGTGGSQKGASSGGTGTGGNPERAASHVDKGAGKAHTGGMSKTFPVITAAEARGDSRPVSAAEFQRLANVGQGQLDGFKARASAPKGLDENWDSIKANSHKAALESWGGDTIDAHTGKSLAKDADVYVVTVKDVGMQSVSVREGATRQEFDAAMDTARQRFGSILSRESHSLGVFHDDDLKRIDIDPVLIVKNRADVDTIGAATHAIGGAYNPKTGDGFWPVHVADA